MSQFTEWIDAKVTLPKTMDRSDDILSSVSHAVGFLLAVAATVMLLFMAQGSSRAIAASLIYGLSMCTVFGASAVYHGLPISTGKRFMRLIDHSSIYILIAGTYTPYALAMNSGAGLVLLAANWTLCLIGLLLNFFLWDRFKALHIAVYLLMGWMVVFFWRPLVLSAPPAQIRWMMIGGGLYTLGIIFYAVKKIPWNHVIWHFFVIGGAVGLHVGILRYAVPKIISLHIS